MKHLLLLFALLLAAIPCGAVDLPAGFPSTPVKDGRELALHFIFAPHTTADFEMTREMPSGRKLKSKGVFEYRQGQGMMWLIQTPVINAMLISGSSLSVYDSKGKLLRSQDFSQSPVGRRMAGYLAGVREEDIPRLTKAFNVTYAMTDVGLQVGLVPRQSNDAFLWLRVSVKNGVVDAVEYDAGKNGRASVKFSNVHNGDEIPGKPFEITPRR